MMKSTYKKMDKICMLSYLIPVFLFACNACDLDRLYSLTVIAVKKEEVDIF